MPLDPVKLAKIVSDSFGSLPHPDVPNLTNAEYATYQRVAAMQRNPHPATHEDVKNAAEQLKAVDLSPHEWEYAWSISRPLANRLLGRDPTIQELVRHRDAHPGDIHDFYSRHPSTSHPEIPAGTMIQYAHMAADAASRHLDRAPHLKEVAQFAAAGHSTDHIEEYYQRMAQEREDG